MNVALSILKMMYLPKKFHKSRASYRTISDLPGPPKGLLVSFDIMIVVIDSKSKFGMKSKEASITRLRVKRFQYES